MPTPLLYRGILYMVHHNARIVAHDLGGAFPRTEAELQTLPGIGPYTSAAIAAIAFDDPLIEATLGFRAAGHAGNVVFMAGPTITGVGGPDAPPGVNMFAFRRDTREFLGSRKYPEYSNIRKMIRVLGQLPGDLAL